MVVAAHATDGIKNTDVAEATPSHVAVAAHATERIRNGQQWCKHYLTQDVQQLQEHKQHHIHLPNEQGVRVPLGHCRRKDNPKLCKSDYPRTAWLIDRAVVLCTGLIKQMGMALTGRRCQLGALHGPMNEENLNGTHPAMLAAQRCNSDVQLPYRLPVCEATHDCPDASTKQMKHK